MIKRKHNLLILGNTVHWNEKEFHNFIESIEKEIRDRSYQCFKIVQTVGIMDETELNNIKEKLASYQWTVKYLKGKCIENINISGFIKKYWIFIKIDCT